MNNSQLKAAVSAVQAYFAEAERVRQRKPQLIREFAAERLDKERKKLDDDLSQMKLDTLKVISDQMAQARRPAFDTIKDINVKAEKMLPNLLVDDLRFLSQSHVKLSQAELQKLCDRHSTNSFFSRACQQYAKDNNLHVVTATDRAHSLINAANQAEGTLSNFVTRGEFTMFSIWQKSGSGASTDNILCGDSVATGEALQDMALLDGTIELSVDELQLLNEKYSHDREMSEIIQQYANANELELPDIPDPEPPPDYVTMYNSALATGDKLQALSIKAEAWANGVVVSI